MAPEEEGFTPVSLHESDDLEMTPTERRVTCRKCGDIIGFFCGCSIDCSCFQSAADDHLRKDRCDGLMPPRGGGLWSSPRRKEKRTTPEGAMHGLSPILLPQNKTRQLVRLYSRGNSGTGRARKGAWF